MNPTEQSAKTPSPRTGAFALLAGLLRGRGSGAPSRRSLRALALAATLALALLAPSAASAHFVRPYLRNIASIQVEGSGELTAGSPVVKSLTTTSGAFAPGQSITGPGIPAGTTVLAVESTTLSLSAAATQTNPAATLSAESPLGRVGGLAVDAEDDLWAGGPGTQLERFNSAYAALEPNSFLPPPLALSGDNEPSERLATSLTSGDFYVSAQSAGGGQGHVGIYSHAGTLLHTIEHSQLAGQNPSAIALDNSSGPSHGSLYVVQETGTVSAPDTIFKFNGETAKPEPFTGCGAECSSYVSEDRLTGIPSGETLERVEALAVDPTSGDIYVAVQNYIATGEPGAIFEYAPSGKFIRAITGQGVPRPPGSIAPPLAGIDGLAVDPASGDLLASLAYNNESSGNAPAGAVDEFDSSGHFLGQLTEAAGGPLTGANALALDSKGNLYVVNGADINHVGADTIDVYQEGHFVPALRLGAAEAHAHPSEGAVLNGSVNPESSLTPEPSKYGISDCHFEYTTQSEFDAEGFTGPGVQNAPCESPGASGIPKNDEYTPVHAAISGLSAGETYRYRLSATESGALGGAPETSSALAFTAPAPPTISATTANDITSAFASLGAKVDPLGADTHYRFEYEAIAEGVTPFSNPTQTPEADLGSGGPSGNSSEALSAPISGLKAQTAYRFRAIAENEAGPTTGEEATFTTQAAAAVGLPDNRAYELLTPPDKEGAEDMFGVQGGVFAGDTGADTEQGMPSESGDQFILTTRAAFGPDAASGENTYRFSRHPSGWSFSSLAAPGLGIQSLGLAGEPAIGAIEPDEFSRVALNDQVGAPQSEAGVATTDLLGAPGGPYATLHADQSRHQFPFYNGEEPTKVIGATTDLSHLILSGTDRSLAPQSEAAEAAKLDEGAPALFESDGSGECSAAAENCPLIDLNSSGRLISACGAVLGSSSADGGAYRAVSAKGDRAFFTAPVPLAHTTLQLLGKPGCPSLGVAEATTGKAGENLPQLYLRSGGETLEISNKPAPGAPAFSPGRYEAAYISAAADGSRVFFRSGAWLTPDHPTVHDPELYEWRIPGTVGSQGTPAAAAPCEESSPNFVAASQGCLTRISAGEAGQPAGSGGANLERAPVLSADGSAVYFTAFGKLAEGAEEHPVPTNDHNSPVNLYRYDTASATLAFVARVSIGDYPDQAGCAGTGGPCSRREYYTTPDGRYLLFASQYALTPDSHQEASTCLIPQSQAIGGHCSEVYRYRYEPATPGAGSLLCVSCNPDGEVPTASAQFTYSAIDEASTGPTRALSDDGAYAFFDTAESLLSSDRNGAQDVYEWHGGHISLLSSGADSSPSWFLGTDPSGHDAFIGTHARLLPQDTDTKGDLYDARICSAAEPCIEPPPPPGGICVGDSCHPPVPAPNDETPGSLTYHGPGNVKEEPAKPTCPKGKVRNKAGKCVAKHHKKKRGSHKRANTNRRAGR